MRAVLDELGITDPETRKFWIDVWQELSAAESDSREKVREREKARHDADLEED